MSSDPDTTRIVRSWLDEGVTQLPDRVLDAVLDQVPATPQRRATWWRAGRTPIMNKILGFGLAAAAVVVLVFVGAQLFGAPTGNVGSQATPTPEPTVTAEPTATPEPSPTVAAGLPEGPHPLWETDGAVSITVTITAPGWVGEPGGGFVEKGVDGADPPGGAGMIAFADPEYYVYGDPCAWSSTRPDAPATTVDDLVAALADQASREASAPEDITVNGYAGKKIILRMADEVSDFDACDEGTFALFGVAGEDPARYSQGPGQIEEVWIVDVDGVTVILLGGYYAETPQNVVDEVQAILASATFEML